MNDEDRTDIYIKILLEIITEHLPDCKVYLYGSRARKDHFQGSDIDIALDNQKKIDWSIMSKIIGSIEESTVPIFVDVIDLHAVSEDMIEQVKQDGVIWKN